MNVSFEDVELEKTYNYSQKQKVQEIHPRQEILVGIRPRV